MYSPQVERVERGAEEGWEFDHAIPIPQNHSKAVLLTPSTEFRVQVSDTLSHSMKEGAN